MFIKGFFLAVGLSALGAMVSGTANAAICAGPDRSFELTVSSGCYAYGGGNINGNASHDPMMIGANSGGNTITYISSALGGLDFIKGLSNWSDSSLSSSVVGSVTVAASDLTGFTNYVLGLKVGNNKSVSWASFMIAGAGTFDFTITPKQGAGISHVNLYGVRGTTTQIPLPATGLLFIVGFAGLLGTRRLFKQ